MAHLLLAAASGGSRGACPQQVASLAALDPLTFRVVLKQADCPFLTNAMTIPLVPQHLLAGSADINTDPFNSSRPVGTGPYVFKECQKDDHLTLVANPIYWQGRPRIDQWIRKVVKDDNVILGQLKTGEVDYATLQPDAVEELTPQPNLNVTSFPGPITGYIAYNLDRPLFQDQRVRLALTYALDRELIVQRLLWGHGQVLNSPIVPHSWAYDTRLPTYPYDPDKARQLLAEAGWTPGPDGILQKDGQRFAFTLTTNTGNKVREAVAIIAQDQWAKVGIEVQPQLLQFSTFNERFQQTHDFDAVVAGATLGVAPDQTSTWSSQAYPTGESYVHYRNPRVDALLEQARTLPSCDQAARKALYDQFQEQLVADQPYTFLYAWQTGLAVNKRLQNVMPSPWAGSSPYVAWSIKDWGLADQPPAP
jgi:peptide/nickel transport system substrate-binding protein